MNLYEPTPPALSREDRISMVWDDWTSGRISRVRADEMFREIDRLFPPAAPPRCAVCGGPDADGNGCEFCPADKAPWRA